MVEKASAEPRECKKELSYNKSDSENSGEGPFQNDSTNEGTDLDQDRSLRNIENKCNVLIMIMFSGLLLFPWIFHYIFTENNVISAVYSRGGMSFVRIY